MRIEKIQGNAERQILIGMVVDPIVLGRIATKWDKELFNSSWANLVGGWCVKFHQQYGKAPRAAIQGLFEAWSLKAQNKDMIAVVEKFLVGLSGEYKQLAREINSDYLIDLAAKHFTRVKTQKVITAAQGLLDSGDDDGAQQRLVDFNSVQLGAGESVDVLSNKEAIMAAFEEAEEDVITYPGALGQFFRGQLTRDGFVVFLAPEKRGKSWWLMDMAWRGLLQRRRVAFISAGDMSEKQMMRRLMVRAARHPIRAKSWPLVVKYPEKMRRVNKEVQIKHKLKTFDSPLDWRKAWKACQEITEFRVRGKDYLRLATYPNSTLSVRGIAAQVRQWIREGWMPDVVIVDYADILDEESALPGSSDQRHKINASWKQMRALSQMFHILFVTATQANAASYEQDLLKRSNFSEDKRKLAHVTGMCGINQKEALKEMGAFELNWLALREGEYSENQTVAVASCLALGNPAVCSCF